MSKAEGDSWGAFGFRRKKREKVPQRTCLALDCGTLIDGDNFMCRAHWNKVPLHVQASMRLALNADRLTDFEDYLKRAREYAALRKAT